MKFYSTFTKGIVAMSALASSSALAATFVYVSNAEDGEIGAYSMQADGALKPLARTQAGKVVMPMAVSPNRRLLYAAAIAGEAGVRHGVRLLREEIERDMALLGITKLTEMTRERIRPRTTSSANA